MGRKFSGATLGSFCLEKLRPIGHGQNDDGAVVIPPQKVGLVKLANVFGSETSVCRRNISKLMPEIKVQYQQTKLLTRMALE